MLEHHIKCVTMKSYITALLNFHILIYYLHFLKFCSRFWVCVVGLMVIKLSLKSVLISCSSGKSVNVAIQQRDCTNNIFCSLVNRNCLLVMMQRNLAIWLVGRCIASLQMNPIKHVLLRFMGSLNPTVVVIREQSVCFYHNIQCTQHFSHNTHVGKQRIKVILPSQDCSLLIILTVQSPAGSMLYV